MDAADMMVIITSLNKLLAPGSGSKPTMRSLRIQDAWLWLSGEAGIDAETSSIHVYLHLLESLRGLVDVLKASRPPKR